jgi:hypothetical protein
VRREQKTSVEKFFSVLDLCAALGIHTSAAKVGALWVVPLFSWYEPQFDADNSGDSESLSGWADFYLCKWPIALGQVSDFFLRMNESRLLPYDDPVAQIRSLHARIHVFGHSHISCDRVIEGVRYIQNPLRYPRERTMTVFPMKLIADGDRLTLPPA